MPFVGLAPYGWQPRAVASEVHAILTPSLRRLADPTIHRVVAHRMWQGQRYAMHEYAVHDPPLWGATALMVWELPRRLELAGEP